MGVHQVKSLRKQFKSPKNGTFLEYHFYIWKCAYNYMVTNIDSDRPNPEHVRQKPNRTEGSAEPNVRQKYAPFAEHVRPFWPNIVRSAEL